MELMLGLVTSVCSLWCTDLFTPYSLLTHVLCDCIIEKGSLWAPEHSGATTHSTVLYYSPGPCSLRSMIALLGRGFCDSLGHLSTLAQMFSDDNDFSYSAVLYYSLEL